MSLFKEEMPASECALLTMGEYSAYTIKSKFPNTIDGLKPIHRRILLTLDHQPAKGDKEATITGRVMEMHPHGDASISDAISGLAQPFGNIIPLVESDSNLGTYDGEKPGAPRYVEIYTAEVAEDLFFRNTDKSSLKMVPGESLKPEPANLVPVIPTALLIPILGIGCGYKTETSAISVEEACYVAKKFVELKHKYPTEYMKRARTALASYLLPDFSSYCHLRNSQQIISEYRKGNFDCKFVLDGIMKVTKDSITVTTLPPDCSFGKITAAVGTKTIQDKTSWLHEHFTDAADLGGKKVGCLKGNYFFPCRRGDNPFESLTMFKRQIQFTSTWTPNRLYNDEEKGLSAEDPLTLLDKWSDARFHVVLGGLKQRLNRMQERYHQLMALIIVVDHVKEVCDIFNTATDEDSTVPILMKKFGLSAFQAKFLQTLPLKKLTAKGRKELTAEVDEIRVKNKELQMKFAKIHEEIISGIEAFENKHGKNYPAKCTIPNYIGYACYKNTGWILIEDVKEFDALLSDFEPEHLRFHLFQHVGKIGVIGADESDINDPDIDAPKYIHASYVYRLPYIPKSLSIHIKDGAAFVPKPNVAGLLENDPVPIGDKNCTVICKSGRMLVPTTGKYARQSHNVQSPSIKDVLFTSPLDDEEVIVVHGNTEVSGTINIDRIKGNGPISRVPIGKTKVIGVYRIGMPVAFSIPPDLSARCSIKHMFFDDLSRFVAPNSTLKLKLTKKKTSDDRDLVPHAKRSALFTIAD